MSRRQGSIPDDYFDALYAGDDDPWRFSTSEYEREKYAATLAALPKRHYANAFEVGCAIGVLTHALAERCDALLAVDVAEKALAQARRRCSDQTHVRFAKMRVPDVWPESQFDLIMLSEVVYYLDQADVIRLAERVSKTLTVGGTIVLVHWTGVTDYPQSADDACLQFIQAIEHRAEVVRQDRTDQYRLDVLSRV